MDSGLKSETSETQDSHQELFAEWTKFPIKDVKNPQAMVLMDDYLIILALCTVPGDEDFSMSEQAHLFAVDLRDLIVQKARIDEWDFESFGYHNYTLEKYNENQIIAFDANCCPQMLIIESFQPLSVKLKHIDIEQKIQSRRDSILQIHENCFYIFETDYRKSLNTLWCYDLENKTWKVCETVGEGPGPQEKAKSFVLKDKLYVYGGWRKDRCQEQDIFMLNFGKKNQFDHSTCKFKETMEWIRFQQEEDYFEGVRFNGEIYNEHMVLLISFNDFYEDVGTHQLHCWNIHTNSWKIFKIKEPDLYSILERVFIHKDSLWAIQECGEEGICLQKYNLDDLGLEAPLSPEEQLFKALFMNENESDVKFKVQDKIIPAHKEVLIKRSQFFAGLWKSEDINC